MNDGYMDAAAVPVPDQMADALQSALPLATFLAPNKLPLDARDVAQMQAHRLRGQGYRLVPVPDAGDDTLRTELARAFHECEWSQRGIPCKDLGSSDYAKADALLPRIRDHVTAAVQAERERLEQTEQAYEQLDDDYGYQMKRAEKAEAAIERVKALRPRTASGMIRDFVPYADLRAALDWTEATG